MRKSLINKTATVAVTSFTGALAAGGFFLFGMVGANAAGETNCNILTPVETVSEYGMTTLDWTAEGNCTGVVINLVSIDQSGTEKIVTSDNLEDLTASFTYGTLAVGTSYDFQVVGATAETNTAVSIKTVVG